MMTFCVVYPACWISKTVRNFGEVDSIVVNPLFIFSFNVGLRKLLILVEYPSEPENQYLMARYEALEDTFASPVLALNGTKLMTNNVQLYLVYDHRQSYSACKCPITLYSFFMECLTTKNVLFCCSF